LQPCEDPVQDAIEVGEHIAIADAMYAIAFAFK
jgi:hypothetical protein